METVDDLRKYWDFLKERTFSCQFYQDDQTLPLIDG